ncbi:hypothetical protein ACH4TQ_14945 [Streptomyces sp. NPDC021218]|uniref:hypothetical protein n=1 Tax=Streptomyces sp. NPDC021218 TaxID=3365119 RepID=UPI00378A35BC
MLQRVRTVWHETPPLTKTLCKVMPPLGGVIVALGVLGDLRGWWEGLGFLTNLVSSFAGLMFAVPFALVALSRLGEAHALLAEQRATTWHSERILADLHASWSRLDSSVWEINDLALTGSEIRVFTQDSELPEEFHRRGPGKIAFAREELSNLRTYWDVLSGDVRGRRLGVGLAWETPKSVQFQGYFSECLAVFDKLSALLEIDTAGMSRWSYDEHQMRQLLVELLDNPLFTWSDHEGEYPSFGIRD